MKLPDIFYTRPAEGFDAGGLSPVGKVVIFAAAVLLIASHRPDSLLNAQFWAEDGRVWYAQAYNFGALQAFLIPEAGYFQTISRLGAAAAQLVPLRYGPLLFNFIAIAVQASVACFLASPRMAGLMPDLRLRLILGFVYVALPHSFETTANLTNAQWHLAVLCFLVVIASPAAGVWGRILDIAVVALSAVSGPFALLLLPIAVIRLVAKRERRLALLTGVLAAGASIQLASLLTFERPSDQILGATPTLFAKIVGGRLFFSTIFSDRIYQRAIDKRIWGDAAAFVVLAAGLAGTIFAIVRARLEVRLFVLFSALISAAALISPAISRTSPQWELMWAPPAGSRYWMIPGFCMMVCVIYLAWSLKGRLRLAAAGLACLSAVGIFADWSQPRFKDLAFAEHAARFEAAAAGEEVVIPINPDWDMLLVKK